MKGIEQLSRGYTEDSKHRRERAQVKDRGSSCRSWVMTEVARAHQWCDLTLSSLL